MYLSNRIHLPLVMHSYFDDEDWGYGWGKEMRGGESNIQTSRRPLHFGSLVTIHISAATVISTSYFIVSRRFSRKLFYEIISSLDLNRFDAVEIQRGHLNSEMCGKGRSYCRQLPLNLHLSKHLHGKNYTSIRELYFLRTC